MVVLRQKCRSAWHEELAAQWVSKQNVAVWRWLPFGGYGFRAVLGSAVRAHGEGGNSFEVANGVLCS